MATTLSGSAPIPALEDRPPAFHIGARIIVVASGLLSSFAITGLTPVLPQIAEALEPGPGTLMTKQLVGIVGLAMALGSPLAGLLISRTSPRMFVTGALLLYTLAGTAGLYLSDLPLLIASRFLVGLGTAGLVIMALTLINTRLAGTDRARWIGIQVAIAMISALLINPVSGALGQISWRLPFALFLLGLPAAMVGWITLEHARPSVAPPSAPTAGSLQLGWLPWRYAALALAIGSITYVPVIYGPFLMHQLGATSAFLIGIILTADSLLGALVALLYGPTRRWLNARQTFAFSFAFLSAGAAIAGLAQDLTQVIAGMLISGIGMGWLVPNLIGSVAAHVAPDRQSRAVGFVKFFHYIASPASILLIEPFAKRTGPAGAPLAVSILALALLVFWSALALTGRARMRRGA